MILALSVSSWQVKVSTIFDNILINDDVTEADAFAKDQEAFREVEQNKRKEEKKSKRTEDTKKEGDDEDDECTSSKALDWIQGGEVERRGAGLGALRHRCGRRAKRRSSRWGTFTKTSAVTTPSRIVRLPLLTS